MERGPGLLRLAVKASLRDLMTFQQNVAHQSHCSDFVQRLFMLHAHRLELTAQQLQRVDLKRINSNKTILGAHTPTITVMEAALEQTQSSGSPTMPCHVYMLAFRCPGPRANQVTSAPNNIPGGMPRPSPFIVVPAACCTPVGPNERIP